MLNEETKNAACELLIELENINGCVFRIMRVSNSINDQFLIFKKGDMKDALSVYNLKVLLKINTIDDDAASNFSNIKRNCYLDVDFVKDLLEYKNHDLNKMIALYLDENDLLNYNDKFKVTRVGNYAFNIYELKSGRVNFITKIFFDDLISLSDLCYN